MISTALRFRKDNPELFETGQYLPALEKFPVARRIWRDSYVVIPPEAPDTLRNALTDEMVSVAAVQGSAVIYLSDGLK